MDYLIYIIFICIALPLLLSLILMDNKGKLLVGFIIMGAFMCVFVSEVNTILSDASKQNLYYVTTNITPITEEIVKAIPILIFAFAYSDDRPTLISLSMAVGIGFAIVENMFIFTQSGAVYSLFWAIKRVFGASLMHALCTALVGYGISFVRKRRKLFYTGTFALLVSAIVYHSTFNALIQSPKPTLGLLLPVVTYIIVIFRMYKLSKKEKEQEQ